MLTRLTLPLLTGTIAWVLAFPALASAGTPVFDSDGGSFPNTFGTVGGPSQIRGNGYTISCLESEGSGNFSNGSSGNLWVFFDGCKESVFNTSCNTPGWPSGLLQTEQLTFVTAYLTANKTTPGLLVKPPASGLFLKIVCGGGLFSFEVKGNGVMGAVTSPLCKGTSKGTTLEFAATGTSQAFKQSTGTGTNFDLNIGGETASFVEEMSFIPDYSMTLTCV